MLLLATNAGAQDFDQLTRPMALIADSSQITAMLGELLIPVDGPVSRAEVVDFTGNGFGPDDLIILYPTLETYLLGSDVPRTLQEAMKTWELKADYRLDATLDDSNSIAADAHKRQDAKAALMGSVLGAVGQFYDGADIDLRLARDSAGVRLEMWNYDPDAMRYRIPHRAAEHVAPTWPAQRFEFARPGLSWLSGIHPLVLKRCGRTARW